MILYRNDIRMLRVMKRAQSSLNRYVLLHDGAFYPVATLTHFSAEDAISMPERAVKIPISKPLHPYILNRLIELGLINKPVMADIYQVTYDGWEAHQVRRQEVFHTIVTHFMFPSLVALITTLLTLWIQKIVP